MSEKIEPVHVERFNNRAWSISDPCIICGGTFTLSGSGCGHDQHDTEAFIQRIRKLGPSGRKAILNGY